MRLERRFGLGGHVTILKVLQTGVRYLDVLSCVAFDSQHPAALAGHEEDWNVDVLTVVCRYHHHVWYVCPRVAAQCACQTIKAHRGPKGLDNETKHTLTQNSRALSLFFSPYPCLFAPP